MRIEQGQAAMSGAPRENIFVATDDSGQRCGHSIVVEYVNQALLPQRPLNYYIILEGYARARDMLFGAAFARAMFLRKRKPHLAARIYTACSPRDPERLLFLTQEGLVNDDAELVMRWILQEGQRAPKAPVGCQILHTPLNSAREQEELLERMNPFSATVHSMEWLTRLRQEPLFAAFGVVEEEQLLGEIVLSGDGAEGRVHMLYTVPKYRRRGVARALLGNARELFLSNGIRCMTLHVWRRNLPGVYLCESMGFVQASQLMLYPGINL